MDNWKTKGLLHAPLQLRPPGLRKLPPRPSPAQVRPSPASGNREPALSTAGESLSPGQHGPVSAPQQACMSLDLTQTSHSLLIPVCVSNKLSPSGKTAKVHEGCELSFSRIPGT